MAPPRKLLWWERLEQLLLHALFVAIIAGIICCLTSIAVWLFNLIKLFPKLHVQLLFQCPPWLRTFLPSINHKLDAQFWLQSLGMSIIILVSLVLIAIKFELLCRLGTRMFRERRYLDSGILLHTYSWFTFLNKQLPPCPARTKEMNDLCESYETAVTQLDWFLSWQILQLKLQRPSYTQEEIDELVERRERYIRALALALETRKRSLGQLTLDTEYLSPGKQKDRAASDRHQDWVRLEKDIEDFERRCWGKILSRNENDSVTHLTMEFTDLWQYLRSLGF